MAAPIWNFQVNGHPCCPIWQRLSSCPKIPAPLLPEAVRETLEWSLVETCVNYNYYPLIIFFFIMLVCAICYKLARRVGNFASEPTQDFYPVTDPQGFCIIINIKEFGVDCMLGVSEERHGSQRDVERVKFLFENKLHFIVQVKEDLTAEGIDNYLSEVKRKPELAKHGSFVCFLMSHGEEDCIFGSDGNTCKISVLAAKFQSSFCRNLAGKPKIFFIQACRGHRRDECTPTIDTTPAISELDPAHCPADSDFLFCYATTEGKVSHMDKERGSFFVQTLCDYIEEQYKKKDLVEIMTLVNKHMKNHPHREGMRKLRRVPQLVTQLADKVSFDPCRAQQS